MLPLSSVQVINLWIHDSKFRCIHDPGRRHIRDSLSGEGIPHQVFRFSKFFVSEMF